MNTSRYFRLGAETGIGLALITVLMVAGCGGKAGSSSGGGAAVIDALTITPMKGQFASGALVRVKRARDGVEVASGVVDASGSAQVVVPGIEIGPFLIEAGKAGDSYFDESTGLSASVPANTVALRALIPDATSSSAVGVTALTEMAVGQIEVATGGIASATAADVIATNVTVGNSFGIDDPLAAPSVIANGTQLGTAAAGADRYALTLAALAKLAAPGKTALNVIQDLREDAKDGVLDGRVNGSAVASIDAAKLNIGAGGATAASMVAAINTQMNAAAASYATAAVDAPAVLAAINTDLVGTTASARQQTAAISASGVTAVVTMMRQMQEFNTAVLQNIAAGVSPASAVAAVASTAKPAITSMSPVSRGAWILANVQLTAGQTTSITANWSQPAGVVVSQMDLLPMCSHGGPAPKSVVVTGGATSATISWQVGMGQGLCPGWYNAPVKIHVALTYTVNGGAPLKLIYNYNSDDVPVTSYAPANFATWAAGNAALVRGQTNSVTVNWSAPAGTVVTGVSLQPQCSVAGSEVTKTGTVGSSSGTVSWPVGMGVGLCSGPNTAGIPSNPISMRVVLDYTVNGSPRQMARRY